MLRRNDLTVFITSIINDNPHQPKAVHEKLFLERIKRAGYEDYLELALHTVFGFDYRRALQSLKTPTGTELEQRAAARRAVRAGDARAILEIERTILQNLLELRVPIVGKLLRDCTGTECLEIGGFFGDIADRVGPDEMVGERLSEADVQQIAQHYWANTTTQRQRRARPAAPGAQLPPPSGP